MHGAVPRYLQVDSLISACSSVVLMPPLAAMMARRFGRRHARPITLAPLQRSHAWS